jgi:hypothetical protein
MNDLELPKRLSFGDLLNWLLIHGVRPPGAYEQGQRWNREIFAERVQRSEKQVRNWLANRSLPNIDDPVVPRIERAFFGSEQNYRFEWRIELRESLRRTREESTALPIPAPAEHRTAINEEATDGNAKPYRAELAEMVEKLAGIVGKSEATQVINELFQAMRHFPFGRYTDRYIRRIYKTEFNKKYDTELFIEILCHRADSINGHLNGIIIGRIKIIDRSSSDRKSNIQADKASEIAEAWKEKFQKLRDSHVAVIREGKLLLSHELRGEITELLNEIYSSTRSDFDPRLFRLVYSSH